LFAATGVLVAVLAVVLFVPFGGSDETTQETGSPSISDTDLPPLPTVALPSPGETPTGTPTPSPRPLLETISPTPSTVSPSTSPVAPTPRSEPTSTPSETLTFVSYQNCAQVRAAGKAPLHRGDPGYSTKLDKNGDGIACERGNS
jgi:hypothetical protein